MPWGRIDDTLCDHPKVDQLPDKIRNSCIGLWVRAISWSNRHLADGHIPNARLRSLDGAAEHRAALIDVGLFEDEGTGVYIHDYAEFNETKAEVLARRQQAAEAGRLGGLAKRRAQRAANAPLSMLPSEPLADPLSEASTNARVRPVPVPSPVPVERSSQATKAVLPRANGGPKNEPRLTREQLDAWTSFGPEWRAFKGAWLGRGFLWPPSGTAEDDDTSQRGLLWQILDSRPNDIARWVEMAAGRSPREVIDWLLAQWHQIRIEAGVEDESWAAEKVADRERSRTTMTRIGEVLGGTG